MIRYINGKANVAFRDYQYYVVYYLLVVYYYLFIHSISFLLLVEIANLAS